MIKILFQNTSHRGTEFTSNLRFAITKENRKSTELMNSSFSLCVLRVLCAFVRCFMVFVFFLASCASSPKISSPADESGLSLLPAGAKVYLWADTVKARPLLDVLSFQGVNGKEAAQVLDKTKSAALAFFSDGEDDDITSNRQFYIAAMGNYPQLSASLSFAFSKIWKKQKSSAGGSYWYSQADNIALVLGTGLALVSNTDPLAAFPVASAPKGFAEFNRGFALAGWMNDSADAINVFLASMGIPLQIPAEDFFFGARKIETQGFSAEFWDLVFRIRTQSPAQARSLLSLFSIARLFVLRAQNTQGVDASEPMSPQQAAMLLFANVPELNAEYLTLRMDSIETEKIALLFNMFSIYSN
jgi:hypothetical protein